MRVAFEVAVRIALERHIVTHLVEACRKAGFLPQSVWDGEEYVKCKSATQVLDAVFAVDVSTIHFDHGRGNNKLSHGVLIVLGNGVDCISDWHCSDDTFNAMVEKVAEWTRQFEEMKPEQIRITEEAS